MERKMQRKRFLAGLITFIFLLSFLAISPGQDALAASNLAAGKAATSSYSVANLSRLTDGNKDTNLYYGTTTGKQWVQLDLGTNYNLNDIKLWHYFGDTRKYHDVIVQLSNDSKFENNVTTVFNNDADDTAGLGLGAGIDIEYAETATGKDISFGSTDARYVRFYSNGSTANAWNHYVEVEVYETGVPAVIHPTSVSLSKTSDTIAIGATDKLTPIFTPADTTNKNVAWSSSDKTIASVSTDGTVTGVKSGTATITVTTEDGGFTAVCNVNVGNLAYGKVPASSYSVANISRLTDGNKDTNTYYGTTTGKQWVQLDLGSNYNLNDIKLWHYFGDTRNYHDVIVQLSTDSKFETNVTTVFNNDTDDTAGLGLGAGKDTEYAETSTGKDIPVGSLDARYVRFYSNGSTANAWNHYVEVEVYESGVPSAIHPTSVTLNKTTDSIAIGATDKLTPIFTSADTTNKNVTWSSSDEAIASVSTDGTVTGVKSGTAKITVTTEDGGFTAVCNVNVGNLAYGKVPASSYSVANLSRLTDGDKNTNTYYGTTTGKQWVQLDLGSNYILNDIKLWHYFGDTRKYHDVIVQLSNDSKFETGVITVFNNDMDDTAGLGLGAGKDIEYAETSTGKDIPVGSLDARYVRFYSNGSTANAWNHYVEVEVYGSEAAAVIHPTSVDLNKTTDSIEIGATDKLTPIFTPTDTTNKNVTWSSSDETIASVSTDGTVTGVKAGTAKITVTTEDGGFTKDCVVTVPAATVHATKITLNTDSATLIEAKLLTLKVAVVEPSDAIDKTVTWSTDNKNIATVSSKGVVTGVNPGTAVIIAKSADPLSSAAASCTVTVTIGKLLDDKTVYANDKDDLENIYITIPTGNTVTFDQVNAWNIDSTYVKPEMNVRFDYGTPATDTTGVVGNAVIAQRGQWCTYSQLKSYKIELNSGAALWKGQSKVLINKHPWDLSKIRNKLAFDLMKLFPDTFSARDQFCHVYIRNLNSTDKSYKDYGLFTQVEDVGKAYLETRGIEKTMYMYKPQDFEFKLNPALKNVTDPGYSLTEFEEVAEVKGIEDHTRFLEMLNAVNDQKNDINAVITKYFDRDNYIAWLATNCLLSNTDTTSSNFYLFSPVDQDKWYFIPWDYDDSLGYTDQLGADSSDIPSWKKDGVEMYAEVVLHRRFLEDPKNVADLSAKIEQLSAIATKSLVTQKVQTFYNTTNALVTRNPDLLLITDPDEIGTDTATYRAEINRLPSVLDNAKTAYYTGLQKPMPVLLNEVQQSGLSCTFSWDSFDLQGESLTYRLVISTDINFNNIVSDRNNLTGSSLTINLNPGTYYWKVTATDSQGHSQICTSVIYQENADDVYGVKQVVIQ